MKDYYTILGVSKNAGIEEIRQARLKRIKVLHPDRFDPVKQSQEWNQANEMLREVNEAFEALGDPSLRHAYDRQSSETEPKPPQPDRDPAPKSPRFAEQSSSWEYNSPASGSNTGLLFLQRTGIQCNSWWIIL